MSDLFEKLFGEDPRKVPEKQEKNLGDELIDLEAEYGIVIAPGSPEAEIISERMSREKAAIRLFAIRDKLHMLVLELDQISHSLLPELREMKERANTAWLQGNGEEQALTELVRYCGTGFAGLGGYPHIYRAVINARVALGLEK